MREEQREAVGNRKRLLVAVTLLTPILLMLAFELALRLIGFGSSHPLFIDAEDVPGHLQANPHVIQRYYSRAPDLAIDPIYFEKQKPPGSHRIVVQGGSTAAGFPYGRWGGLAGMLGDRLEATFPDRQIEVISTAMAAVNSYTLLDFVDEIIAIEPDAVLIYAGHNEYLGILGVGSALRSAQFRGAARLQIALRKLRIDQLLQWLISIARSLLPGADEPGGSDRGSLMAAAAASAWIPFGSDTYQQGVLQFEANLSEMLEKYREAGIPVYLGTLASNERDQKPFASAVSDGIERAQWEQKWQTYQRAERVGDGVSARTALSELLELDGGVANVWYALGRLNQESGDIRAAREAYRKARDMDQLRFRAPEDFNRVIRRLAERYGATLVDVEQRLADASPEGIIGNEILLEHVHPNAEGYLLLADAYYQALKQNGEIGDWSHAQSLERARRDMPITAIDRILADQAVRELEADFPFRETRQEVGFPTPRNEIERLAEQRYRGELSWIDSMEALLQLYRRAGRVDRAAVVARVTAQAYPTLSAPSFSTGMLFMELKQYRRARRYLDRSLLLEPNNRATLRALIRVDRALGDESQLKIHLARLKELAPLHPAVRRLEGEAAGAPLRPGAPRAADPVAR